MTERFDPLAPPPTVVEGTEATEAVDYDDDPATTELTDEDISEGRRHAALQASIQFYEGTNASPDEAVEAAKKFAEFLENG